jgi:hypothetical protein
MSERWSQRELDYLRRHVGRESYETMARHLCRSVSSVRSRAERSGYFKRAPHWTPVELVIVGEPNADVADLARRLKWRSAHSIELKRRELGLCGRHTPRGPAFEAYLREKHAAGWMDTEIAAGWTAKHPGCMPAGHHSVGVWRRRLGLPDNLRSQHRRRLIAAKTAEQLAAARLPSLAALHRTVVQKRIIALGWPADLRWREAQILSLIWDRGPLTKREICSALGTPFRGARGTLKANEPGGTYMATLMRRGMLISFRRAVGTGFRKVDLYCLAPDIQRRVG